MLPYCIPAPARASALEWPPQNAVPNAAGLNAPSPVQDSRG